jgi:hypothetical protein
MAHPQFELEDSRYGRKLQICHIRQHKQQKRGGPSNSPVGRGLTTLHVIKSYKTLQLTQILWNDLTSEKTTKSGILHIRWLNKSVCMKNILIKSSKYQFTFSGIIKVS